VEQDSYHEASLILKIELAVATLAGNLASTDAGLHVFVEPPSRKPSRNEKGTGAARGAGHYLMIVSGKHRRALRVAATGNRMKDGGDPLASWLEQTRHCVSTVAGAEL
jgi:hypothetical protein